MKARLWILFGFLSLFNYLSAQSVSRFIIVDQFGYLPQSRKVAVLKDPVVGFDADQTFAPDTNYVVVNALSGEHVYRGKPLPWHSGSIDGSSGDRAWHFDFSAVTDTGHYYILDSISNIKSYEFVISPDVYREVLKHAVRSFFYQRAGFAKEAQYAGEGWADGASHIGPLQDKNCRLFNAKTNPATERDLSGGWYDAGDYNKYTNWTANYVVEMMKAYIENPAAWGDDYNIPESGNGIPDLLDEAKWGMDHLLRMQQPDGSVLCIVSESHASPPSAATGQSVYGPATTSASFNTAAAFAIGARVYRSMNMIAYSDTLIRRAEKAWNWAVAHPAVIFNNNSSGNGSLGVGAGNQEEDNYGRSMSKLEASCFLFEATKKSVYRNYFNNNYSAAHLIAWSYAYPYEPTVQDLLLYYTKVPGATASVVTQIRNAYRNAMLNGSENFPAYDTDKDPYLAHMTEYTWGSNNQKAATGSMFYNMIQYGLQPSRDQDALNAALGYVHYIHGVNPINLVYLSNMYNFGGDSCVNEFYHSWFGNGSALWDRVGTSVYGPPPGFVPGGANPSYDWDGCCSTPNCGSAENNAICSSENLFPPKNQPKQKSYKDFNTSWPLNSWSISENSCGYQVSYLKLLSKFVNIYDCNGDSAGTASFDDCGICSGGNTGRTAVEEICDCPDFTKKAFLTVSACEEYVSPSGKYSWTASGAYMDTIPSHDGCDSILNINVTILEPTQSEITVSSCDFYVSPGGKRWFESGTYYDTIPNNKGCDSIVTINLNIPVINTGVSQDEDTLVSSEADVAWQWLDCDNNYQPVDGATLQSFTPLQTGNYAVKITKNGCTDTSECYAVELTGILKNDFGKGLSVFPNPAQSNVTVRMPEIFGYVSAEIRNASGSILFHKEYHREREFYIQLNASPGIYMLTLRNEKGKTAVVKLMVK